MILASSTTVSPTKGASHPHNKFVNISPSGFSSTLDRPFIAKPQQVPPQQMQKTLKFQQILTNNVAINNSTIPKGIVKIPRGAPGRT